MKIFFIVRELKYYGKIDAFKLILPSWFQGKELHYAILWLIKNLINVG